MINLQSGYTKTFNNSENNPFEVDLKKEEIINPGVLSQGSELKSDRKISASTHFSLPLSNETHSVSLSVKGLTEFEFYLDYLRQEGWSIDEDGSAKDKNGNAVKAETLKSNFKVLEWKFKAFLNERNLFINESCDGLLRKEKVLTAEENQAVMKEFLSNKADPFPSDDEISVKSRSKKRSAPISEEGRRLKAILKAFFEFDAYLDTLKNEGWTINSEGKFALDHKYNMLPFSALEERFQNASQLFRLFLEDRGLCYDKKSGLLAGDQGVLGIDQSDAVLKIAMQWIKIKTNLHFYTDFEGVLSTQRALGWDVDRENQVSFDPSGKKVTFADAKKGFLSKKKQFLAYLNSKGYGYDELITSLNKDNFGLAIEEVVKLMENFKALSTHPQTSLWQLVDFEGALEICRRTGWQIHNEEKWLAGPNDEFYTFEEMRKQLFEPKKKSFLDYLDANGLRYNEINKRIVSQKGMVLSDNGVNRIVADFLSPKLAFPDFEELKAITLSTIDYDDFLHVLEEVGWKIDLEKETILSPEGKESSMKGVAEKYQIARAVFIYQAGSVYELEAFLDSKKDQILADFVRKADEQFGLKYDGEKGCFVSRDKQMTVKELLMRLSLKELGIS